jgi:putative oxidoreductase
MTNPLSATVHSTAQDPFAAARRGIAGAVAMCERIPYSLVALLARFSIAAVFWTSAQTKVEGLAINLINGEFVPGWPRLSDSALALFRDEYRLPLLAPELAAALAAVAEHGFALLILLGLATRLSALGLLGMTLVIQLLVYPGAYATHGTWAALLLMLLSRGAGAVSLDRLLVRSVDLPPPRR